MGFYPANAVTDDDIEVYNFVEEAEDIGSEILTQQQVFVEKRTDVKTVLHHLRQQSKKS